MDADSILTVPFREARYAPPRLEVDRRAGGEMVLTNPRPYATDFAAATDALEHWAQGAPHRVWLAERSGDGWRTVTFAEARQRVAALAGGLRDLGLTRGPLLILARNGIDHALITYAAMSQAIPAAPVSPQYGLAGANLARLTHACEVLKPAAVYVEDASLFADGLDCDALAGLPVIAGARERPAHITLDDLLRANPANPVADPHDHAKYLLTSGSTGHPKAVIITHANLALNSAQIAACFEDPDPPEMVNSAPWSHSLGANSILHMMLHRGGTLHIDAGQPTAARFGETVRNLREVATTYHNMVPAGWMLLVDELEKDDALAHRFFERVRILQYGGAGLGQATADRIQAVAVRTVGERITFASGYGATETGPTACNVHWTNARMGLIGLPVPGTSVRLVPHAGKLDFRVKGPQVTPGYLGRPDLSAQVFDDEGYYIVGDAARLVDPARPEAGLIFDGRLSENFKLASGTFVAVGDLRIGAVSAIGGAVTDAVVCGEGDKGYIAQSLARARRAAAIERLFATPPPPDVMVFE
jgi:feruloyl-CoA synthase